MIRICCIKLIFLVAVDSWFDMFLSKCNDPYLSQGEVDQKIQ